MNDPTPHQQQEDVSEALSLLLSRLSEELDSLHIRFPPPSSASSLRHPTSSNDNTTDTLDSHDYGGRSSCGSIDSSCGGSTNNSCGGSRNNNSCSGSNSSSFGGSSIQSSNARSRGGSSASSITSIGATGIDAKKAKSWSSEHSLSSPSCMFGAYSSTVEKAVGPPSVTGNTMQYLSLAVLGDSVKSIEDAMKLHAAPDMIGELQV